jgi:hypothetical protein
VGGREGSATKKGEEEKKGKKRRKRLYGHSSAAQAPHKTRELWFGTQEADRRTRGSSVQMLVASQKKKKPLFFDFFYFNLTF